MRRFQGNGAKKSCDAWFSPNRTMRMRWVTGRKSIDTASQCFHLVTNAPLTHSAKWRSTSARIEKIGFRLEEPLRVNIYAYAALPPCTLNVRAMSRTALPSAIKSGRSLLGRYRHP